MIHRKKLSKTSVQKGQVYKSKKQCSSEYQFVHDYNKRLLPFLLYQFKDCLEWAREHTEKKETEGEDRKT